MTVLLRASSQPSHMAEERGLAAPHDQRISCSFTMRMVDARTATLLK